MSPISKIKLIFRLGLGSVLYVVFYRLQIKFGIMKWRFPIKKIIINEPILSIETKSLKAIPAEFHEALRAEADGILKGNFLFFFHKKIKIKEINWHKLYDNESSRVIFQGEHWSKSYSLLKSDEDVKCIWELSRFYWVLVLIRAYLAFDEEIYLNKANALIQDWVEKNPVNQGVNWACAQETSYRLINILTGSFLIGPGFKVTKGLTDFVESHLKRVYGTLGYAVSQKNNHGTTEAAALFIGGSWLMKNATTSAEKKFAQKCEKQGRQILEKLIESLIQNDGSFSMYSVNYHRVVTQTFSFVLYSINKLGLIKLSVVSLDKIEKLLNFQESLSDIKSGEAPNLGANDSSYLMKLNSTDIKNFIPSNQVMRAMLLNQNRDSRPLCEDLFWLEKNNELCAVTKKEKSEEIFPNFGLVKLVGSKNATAFLKYPSYRFRPSHSDIGHFDFWIDGVNQICDAGTYSYVDSKESLGNDFSSEFYHNSLSVLGEPKLRKASRFLYLDWPKKNGGLTDHIGFCSFKRKYEFMRTVSISEEGCRIEDQFKTEHPIVINWNLAFNEWKRIQEKQYSNENLFLEIQCKDDVNIQLKPGLTSLNYGSLKPIQVLAVNHLGGKGKIVTILRW